MQNVARGQFNFGQGNSPEKRGATNDHQSVLSSGSWVYQLVVKGDFGGGLSSTRFSDDFLPGDHYLFGVLGLPYMYFSLVLAIAFYICLVMPSTVRSLHKEVCSFSTCP